MTAQLQIDISKTASLLPWHEIAHQEAAVQAAHQLLHTGTGPGAEFTGWLDLPLRPEQAELQRIQAAASRIQTEADALVVVGIGGSYQGARAAIGALCHTYHNLLPKARRGGPQIYFAGNELSAVSLTHLLELLEGKEVAVNVISKSGTTTEPAVAFRLLREYMESRYGKDDARQRIYATTDRDHGILKRLAEAEGYQQFVIPDDVGGRYSVLTPVGLLPMAAAGIDITAVMAGAADAARRLAAPKLEQNPAYLYAAARNALCRKGMAIELLVTYEPALAATAGWWKQLFGESEGKDGKGLFPASAEFTTDLHSLGQYVQAGRRHLFETVLQVARSEADLPIRVDPADRDQLNYLAGRTVDGLNRRAFEGTLLAHIDGGVPNLVVSMPAVTPYHYGELLYFFQKACAISGYLLGVNPFDQPGVEQYKQNMFALLGKPGHEERRAQLERRLQG